MLNTKSKIAITGGAGYIGSFTVKYLKELGFEDIVILDNFSTGHKEYCYSRYYKIDLLNSNNLNDIFEKEQFDTVIHFASLIVVPHSMGNPYQYFSHNINTGLNLLEAMKRSSTRQIVFSSTCALYGDPDDLPISEKESVKPQSVYAESKLMIEKMIEWYGRLFDFKYVLLRYFNACGAAPDGSNGELHRPETHLIPKAIVNVLEDKPVLIYGNDYNTKDGTCVRDYIHILDLADAHYKALDYLHKGGKSDVFNLGVGSGYSNLEIFEAIAKIARDYGHEASYQFKPRREGDVATLYADNKKAKEVLDWEPKHTNIAEIVRSAFKWHVNQLKAQNSKLKSIT